MNMNITMFMVFLSENFTLHCNELEECITGTDYFSTADLLLGKWEFSSSLKDYAASVAIRGALMSWLLAKQPKGSFSPLSKPQCWTKERTNADNENQWRNLLNDSMEEFVIAQNTRTVRTTKFAISRT